MRSTAQRTRPARRAVWLAALFLAVVSCGDDAVVVLGSNFGTVDRDATCTAGGGEFPLRQENGLIVIVLIDDDSVILVAGRTFGTCDALKAGSRVNVRGDAEGDRIRADELRIL